jgi:hypothetical protein
LAATFGQFDNRHVVDVVGSFSFEMNALPGNSGGPRSVTTGEFNLRVAS